MDGNKLMKRYSTLWVTKEMQIKITVRYHYPPIRMAKIKKIDHPCVVNDMKASGTLTHLLWEM